MISRLETIGPPTGNLWSVPVSVGWRKSRIRAENWQRLSVASDPPGAWPGRSRCALLVACWLALITLVSTAPLPASVDATGVVERLVALGPRPTGSVAHHRAIQGVRDALAPLAVEVSLSGGSSQPPLATFEALLPGSGEGEILLTAHLDRPPRHRGHERWRARQRFRLWRGDGRC